MKRINLLVATGLILAFIGLKGATENPNADEKPVKTDFESTLLELSKAEIELDLSETGIFNALRRIRWHKETVPGDILSVWAKGEYDSLILNWYRIDEPEKRFLITSLFLCNRIQTFWEPTTDVTDDFFLKKSLLNEEQKKARLIELEYVKANAPRIAKLLLKVYTGKLDPMKLSGLKFTSELKEEKYKKYLEKGWDE